MDDKAKIYENLPDDMYLALRRYNKIFNMLKYDARNENEEKYAVNYINLAVPEIKEFIKLINSINNPKTSLSITIAILDSNDKEIEIITSDRIDSTLLYKALIPTLIKDDNSEYAINVNGHYFKHSRLIAMYLLCFSSANEDGSIEFTSIRIYDAATLAVTCLNVELDRLHKRINNQEKA